MKKGCLIIAIVVPLLLIAVAGVLGYRANRQFGLTEAPVVSYATVVTPDTRFHAVLKPDKLNDILLKYLPKDRIKLPSWTPWSVETLIPKLLPREVALVAGSDYKGGKIALILFANERRGGPVVVQQLNQANPFRNLQQVQWDSKLMQLSQRGAITLHGDLAIPDGLEEKILENWSHEPPSNRISITGDHLLEAVLDNRNGEIMTFAATFMAMGGVEWQEIFAPVQPDDATIEAMARKMGQEIIKSITVASLNADLASADQATIRLSLSAPPTARGQMELTICGMIVPQAREYLRKQMNLTLNGTCLWNDQESALIGDFTLSGFEPLIAARVNAALGAAAPH